MSKEIIEHDTLNMAANHAAMNSVMVMEQWGNGESYNEEQWVWAVPWISRVTSRR